MRTSTRNGALARRIWSATACGDADALEQVLAPDVVWRSHGCNPLAGEFRGRDLAIAQMARITDFTDDLRLELRDIFVSARGAVIDYRLWARRGQRVLEADFQLRLRIEDARVRECDIVPVDQQRTDAFFHWNH